MSTGGPKSAADILPRFFRRKEFGKNAERNRKESGGKTEGLGWNLHVFRLFRSGFFRAERKEEENIKNEIATSAPIPTDAPFETGADAMKKGEDQWTVLNRRLVKKGSRGC